MCAPSRRPLLQRLYGRTKPGTLLKHHIPLKTDRWEVTAPGFTEIDLVAHCGSLGEGEFVHSLNVTDIHTTWVETAAVTRVPPGNIGDGAMIPASVTSTNGLTGRSPDLGRASNKHRLPRSD